MGKVLMESPSTAAADTAGNVVLDIESLIQAFDKCSGSPKMTKALSRKGSSRMERRSGEEQDAEAAAAAAAAKKLPAKGLYSQAEQLVPGVSNFQDAGGDGRVRRFNRFPAINPKRMLLLFASMSSVGTIILIYFTLAIYLRGGA